MRILVISHERELNGASKSLLDVIDHLSGEHDFWVVTNYVEGPFYEQLIKRNIHVVHLRYERWMLGKGKTIKWIIKKLRWWLLSNPINTISSIKLSKVIRDCKIDLVYSNTRVNDIGARCNKITRIPHVWHFREFGEEDFSMYPLTSFRTHYNYISQHSDIIICNSKAVEEKFKVLFPKSDIRVVYNGFEIPSPPRKNPNKELTLLMAGRISKNKGQAVAAGAVNLLLKRGFENIKLYIAGNGNIESYPELKKELNEGGNHIIMMGYVKDMRQLRKKTDIEIVCSKREAFGRVTVEAMLSGNPVIGTDSGGTKELIVDGFNGFLFDGSSQDLSGKIEYFINNPQSIRLFGNNAYSFASNAFPMETYIKSMDAVFHEAVNRKDEHIYKSKKKNIRGLF